MPGLRFLGRFAQVLDLGPLLVAAAAAASFLVAAFGFAMELPLAWLPVGWLCWVLGNYFVEIVEHRALGSAAWPTFSLDTMVAGRRQIGLVLVALGLGVLALRIGLASSHAAAALAVTLGALACAPAVAALLAVTASVPRAVDPVRIARAMLALGVDYGLCVALALGEAALADLAYRRRGPLEIFAAVYGLLAVAFVIGTVVYDRRVALGVYAPRSPEAKLEAERARLERARRTALDHAYGIAGGNAGLAAAHLASYAATESDPLAARVWLFHEAGRWERADAALELGVPLAADLNAAGRAEEAAKVLVTCRYLEDRREKRQPGSVAR